MSKRRFLYTMGGEPLPEPIEVGADFQATPERNGNLIQCDRFMDGDRAPDGTDIGSRQKRRDWMKATGSADYSDFTNHLQRAAAERAAPPKGVRESMRAAVLKLKGY
jgi:hypothetical protein